MRSPLRFSDYQTPNVLSGTTHSSVGADEGAHAWSGVGFEGKGSEHRKKKKGSCTSNGFCIIETAEGGAGVQHVESVDGARGGGGARRREGG